MGDSSPSFSTIKKWAAEFKRGPTSLQVDPRERRPKSATSEITEQVHNMDWMTGRSNSVKLLRLYAFQKNV